jgi:hypothetical protein
MGVSARDTYHLILDDVRYYRHRYRGSLVISDGLGPDTLFPHVKDHDALRQILLIDGDAVAMPPVHVKGVYRVARMGSDPLDGGATQIFDARNCRRQGIGSDEDSGKVHFVAEALAYAEEHWPEDLIEDTWELYVEALLIDTEDLYYRTGNRRFAVGAGLGPLGPTDGASARERSLRIERSIITSTASRVEADELRSDRGTAGTVELHCCALCGGGLGLEECYGCGRSRNDGPQDRQDTFIPLPPSFIRRISETQHKFEIDPSRLVE